MENMLSKIYNPTDLRKLPENQLPQLAKELRDFIIDIVSKKEGHLGEYLANMRLDKHDYLEYNANKDKEKRKSLYLKKNRRKTSIMLKK